MLLGEDIGEASPPEPGEIMVAVDPKVAARALIVREMQRAKMSKSALARKMGLHESAVRRFLRPGATTKMPTYFTALAKLGVRAQTAMVFARPDEMKEAG